MADKTCPECGGKMENPDASSGVCFGCYLAGLYPAGYEEREDYGKHKVYGTMVARCKPRTGKPILDSGQSGRISAMVETVDDDWLQHRCELERQEGLGHDCGFS